MSFSPNNLAVYVCDHVFDGNRPILFVYRSGGDWQFLCGGTHADAARPHVVGVGHLIERDPTLLELDSLPEDWEAEREAVGHAWKLSPCEGED